MPSILACAVSCIVATRNVIKSWKLSHSALPDRVGGPLDCQAHSAHISALANFNSRNVEYFALRDFASGFML